MKLIYSKYLLLLNKNTLFDFKLAFILNQSQRNKLFVRKNNFTRGACLQVNCCHLAYDNFDPIVVRI